MNLLCTLIMVLFLVTLLPSVDADDQQSEALSYHWSASMTGEVKDSAVSNDLMYLACNGSGVQVIDLWTMKRTDVYNTSGLAYGIEVHGRYLYVADWDKGLVILDTAYRGELKLVGSMDTPGFSYQVTVSGNLAYVCDWHRGLAIIDISDRSDPMEIGRYEESDYATDCLVTGKFAYLVDWEGVHIINMVNPSYPNLISNISTPGNAYSLAIMNDYLLVADDHRGLRVLDIQDPKNPEEVASYIPDGYTVDVSVSGNYAYLSVLGKGIIVLDMTDPLYPVEVAHYSMQGKPRSVDIHEGMVIISDDANGVVLLEEYTPPEKPREEHSNIIIRFLLAMIITMVCVVIFVRKTKHRNSVISKVKPPAGISNITGNKDTACSQRPFLETPDVEGSGHLKGYPDGTEHKSSQDFDTQPVQDPGNDPTDILRKKLMKGDSLKPGGYHALAMLYLLAAHLEGGKCSVEYFAMISKRLSCRMKKMFESNPTMDTDDTGLALSCLLLEGNVLSFPFNEWQNIVRGRGIDNPFAQHIHHLKGIQTGSSIFEAVKREAVSQTWKDVLNKYQKNPGTGRDSILSLCEVLLQNFRLSELEGLGVDAEIMREIAVQYSHLPISERILHRLERIISIQAQQVIEIHDSVVTRTRFG